MSTHPNDGASAPVLAAPEQPLKDEPQGVTTEGFEVQGKADSRDFRSAPASGQAFRRRSWVVGMGALDLRAVDPARRAPVAIDSIDSARRQWSRENRRPKSLTTREALTALKFEALLVGVAAANIRHGEQLTEDDFARLALAVRRIDTISGEAL